MWVVYIIQNDFSEEIYIGITKDLKRRISTHNSNGKKFTTRKNGKWILIYAEAYKSKKDAIVREMKLKNHGSAKHNLIKRIKNSLIEHKTEAGRSESIPGDCLSKTQVPANSQEDV